jgi:hypothetical protein
MCNFSTLLLPRPSYAQMFFSAPYSQTPSVYVPPSMCATKFDTHTKKIQLWLGSHMPNITRGLMAEEEIIWIFRTEFEQYFKMITVLSFVVCIESRGNVKGNKCAVAIMRGEGVQQIPKRKKHG